MSTVRWKKFFSECGLPADACENYVVIFTENRIRFDMLNELNKEILLDMGIRKMGDIISILRRAKEVHSSSYREQLFAKDSVERPSQSQYSKADSTICNDPLRMQSEPENPVRRVVLAQPKRFTSIVSSSNKNNNNETRTQPRVVRPLANTCVKPTTSSTTINPVVVRNVTGLISMPRKRIEPPNDNDEDPCMPSRLKTAKIETNNNPVVRNRIEAQNRLTNFSKEIQKAIHSNQHPAALSTTTSHNHVSQQLVVAPKVRLTRQHIADSTSSTPNLNLKQPIKKKISVKARLGNVSSGDTGIQARVGKKSVFDRLNISTASSTSVFNRLGS